MPVNLTKINQKGKLTHMVARDLFLPSVSQIFDAHSGKFVGMLIDGKEIIINDQGEPEIKPQPINQSTQLNLF